MADHLQSDEDVEHILKLAVQKSFGETENLRQRMEATAQELGITPEQLAEAEARYIEQKATDERLAVTREQEERDWMVFRREQVHEFVSHLATYVAVNAGLFGIDWFAGSSHSIDWAYWPLMGWGIGVAVHAANLLAKFSADNMKEFRRWQKKRRKNPDLSAQ